MTAGYEPRKTGYEPVLVEGIELRISPGGDVEVVATVDGRDVEVIRTSHSEGEIVGHYVSPLGIRQCLEDQFG